MKFNIILKLNRLKLRWMVWSYRRKGFFDWMPLHKIPVKKREIKHFMRIGLVDKWVGGKIVMYRFNHGAFKRHFGLC